MNQKLTLITGAVLGALAVGLGAFGAHALKDLLTQNSRLETYELAVRYHFYHAISILVVGAIMEKFLPAAQWVPLLMLLGVILFSGSLYVYSLTNIKGFAMITPVGWLISVGGMADISLRHCIEQVITRFSSSRAHSPKR